MQAGLVLLRWSSCTCITHVMPSVQLLSSCKPEHLICACRTKRGSVPCEDDSSEEHEVERVLAACVRLNVQHVHLRQWVFMRYVH